MNTSLVYVSDSSAGTITKFHEDGSSMIVAGSPNSSFGKLESPAGILLDQQGRLLYAASTGGCLIYQFDPSGNASIWVGNVGAASALAMDRYGNLYAAIAGNPSSIVLISANGTVTSIAPNITQPLASPYLAFDASGNLYLSTTKTVQKFTPPTTGVVWSQTQFYPASGNANNSIYGLAFDDCGRLFIALQNSGSIIFVFPDGSQGGRIPPGGPGATDNTFAPMGIAFAKKSRCLYTVLGTGTGPVAGSVVRYHLDGSGQVFAAGFSNAQYLAVGP